MNAKLFFSADYRDGRVRIGSKTYSAGYYCVHLLNQYYKDDTAARISVLTNRNWQLQEQLNAGYLNANPEEKDPSSNWLRNMAWLPQIQQIGHIARHCKKCIKSSANNEKKHLY